MSANLKISGINNLCADIDPNGDFLYIAVADADDSDNPKVLRLNAELTEDADVVYNPGTGTAVNLKCGRLEDVVWIVGDFTNKTVRTNNVEGTYWLPNESVYWTGSPGPLFVGPGNDNLVVVALPDTDQLYETYFVGETGPYWIERNDALPIDVLSIARPDLYADQVMIGVDDYWYDPYWYEVEYSPDRGLTNSFVDVSGSLQFLGVAVTTIIIG